MSADHTKSGVAETGSAADAFNFLCDYEQNCWFAVTIHCHMLCACSQGPRFLSMRVDESPGGVDKPPASSSPFQCLFYKIGVGPEKSHKDAQRAGAPLM